ncbi:solute carrier family 17 member 9-like isoform X2 [Dunckerocampus dactyliophorus]|uniref:solute carrier family 17 member 9-like isoform X2 n=1 Tax=Dunckerocampus dactyliophorus TaxID=161453 RepID=UPI00240678A3|nr:solute carrier family 17 member 9-like isoform X2 [Dunckerocampus dactyliophorus]XP_054652292.1 solute carrier family 17 member 9-like isoform X2 [Dunckerocampus dactyliophorus]
MDSRCPFMTSRCPLPDALIPDTAVARKWMPVLFVGTCLLYCARMTMPVCAVSMATMFHWSKIDTGLALGGFFWGYSCTQILGGHASDKIGGERVLFFSAASWAMITAATPFLAYLGTHTLALMTMARVLMGLVQGVFFPSLASLIAQRAAEGEKGFLMSIMQSGSSFGILIAGGLGSLMLDWYNWESTFYAVGFLSGLWALIVWQCLLKGQPYPMQRERRNDSQSKSFSISYLLHLLRKPCVWAMVFAHLCTCGTSYVLLSWMPTYFSEEYPHATTWVYNVFPWLASIPAALWGGYVSDSLISQGYSVVFVRKTMQFIAMGASGVFVIPLTGKVSFPMAVILISAAMVSLSLTSSGASVNVQDLTPSCAGALFGFMNMLGAFMGVVMVSLTGYLIEVTQSWAAVFSLITAVHAVGLGVFLYFGDAQRVDLGHPKTFTQM